MSLALRAKNVLDPTRTEEFRPCTALGLFISACALPCGGLWSSASGRAACASISSTDKLNLPNARNPYCLHQPGVPSASCTAAS